MMKRGVKTLKNIFERFIKITLWLKADRNQFFYGLYLYWWPS